jgi:hypothetical protein
MDVSTAWLIDGFVVNLYVRKHLPFVPFQRVGCEAKLASWLSS